MKRFKLNTLSLLLIAGMASSSFASNVTLDGTITTEIPVIKTKSLTASASSTNYKSVKLQKVILSPAARRFLALNKVIPIINDRKLPSKVFLGMSDVPVLDQGAHGTCVTFAVTGAIDAAMADYKKIKGDNTYSQLCSLELGMTLQKTSSYELNTPNFSELHNPEDTYNKAKQHPYDSGWDGSWATTVIEQIQKYGLISMDFQKEFGCAGVKVYPDKDANYTGNPMPIADYVKNSDKFFKPLKYKYLMTVENAFTPEFDMNKLLQSVKAALAKCHRVTFGTLLDVQRGGVNGALGSNKVKFDTWMLTPEIESDVVAGTIEAGHEMIIIGYDDNAVVDGHKGVLTLRNSWGNTGDNGNYYMTYDHFTRLTLEVAEYIPGNK